jgi:hypothetical protein
MMRGAPHIPTEAPRVTIYRGRGCHLCDVARLQIRALQQTLPCHIEEIDIATDPALERQYLLEIPVVAVAGRVVTQGAIDLGAVRQAILEARLANLGDLGGTRPADPGTPH